jgi:hypothetical protein
MKMKVTKRWIYNASGALNCRLLGRNRATDQCRNERGIDKIENGTVGAQSFASNTQDRPAIADWVVSAPKLGRA